MRSSPCRSRRHDPAGGLARRRLPRTTTQPSKPSRCGYAALRSEPCRLRETGTPRAELRPGLGLWPVRRSPRASRRSPADRSCKEQPRSAATGSCRRSARARPLGRLRADCSPRAPPRRHPATTRTTARSTALAARLRRRGIQPLAPKSPSAKLIESLGPPPPRLRGHGSACRAAAVAVEGDRRATESSRIAPPEQLLGGAGKLAGASTRGTRPRHARERQRSSTPGDLLLDLTAEEDRLAATRNSSREAAESASRRPRRRQIRASAFPARKEMLDIIDAIDEALDLATPSTRNAGAGSGTARSSAATPGARPGGRGALRERAALGQHVEKVRRRPRSPETTRSASCAVDGART